MSRIRIQGQIYTSDEEELERVKVFDLFSVPDEIQVMDMTLNPSDSRSIDPFDVVAFTDIAIFTDEDITVTITGTDVGVITPHVRVIVGGV
jgi:hypothetical protein